MNLNIHIVALFIVCQTTQCIVLTVQRFYLRENKDPSVPLGTRDKRVFIPGKPDIISENQYHKDATYVAHGIIEKY